VIRPLRRAHRGAFTSLAVVLPVFLGASLWRGRRPPPTQELSEDFEPRARATDPRGSEWLAYWVDAPAPTSGVLPEGAEFVGTARSGALALQPPPGKAVVAYDLLARTVRPAEDFR
jgi:hypothetical protein